MRAIVFDEELKFLEDQPMPEPKEGEALIRVSMAGICETDLEITKGYMGFQGILGHEFVGEVVEVRGGSDDFIGKRVTGEINCSCGRCDLCLRGLRTHCTERTVLGILGRNGAFADYVALPLENLLEIPENVTDREAVFTEPLAAAFEILEQVHVRPTDKVLILGDGKLGIQISLVLNLSQADVTLVGKHENKLKVARNQNVKTKLLKDLVMEKEYDIVVDATGSGKGFDTALQVIRPRGRLVMKTTVAASKEMNLAPVVIDELRIIGSRCGPFEPALRALSSGAVDVEPLISHVYGFDRAKEAFLRVQERGTLKVLIEFC